MLKSILLTIWLLCASAFAADISGKWEFAVQLDAGSGSPTFTFQQTGDKMTGTYNGLLGNAELNGTVKGDVVEFSFESAFQGEKVKVVYKGTIASDKQMK